MKKIILFTLLFALIGTFLPAQTLPSGTGRKTTCWTVHNTTPSFMGLCPYLVCAQTQIVNSSTNLPVPGTQVTQCYNIPSGGSYSFCHPASPAPGYHVALVAMGGIIASNSVTFPPNSFTTYPGHNCESYCPGAITYWSPISLTQFHIQGNCILGL